MKKIQLLRMVLKNFRSFNDETIIFQDTPGYRFVGGVNLREPRLSGNGCGKSTVWDGLCFCLYGTSIKGLRASVLTSYGEKNSGVECSFLIDDEECIIKREGPPERIYINSERVEQESVDVLIGLSRKRFCNSIILGQGEKLFPDLPIPGRGELLDEILNLEYYLQASSLAGSKASDSSNKLQGSRTAIARLEGQIQGLPDVETLRSDEAGWEAGKQAKINAVIEQMEASEGALTTLKEKLRGNMACKIVGVDVLWTRYQDWTNKYNAAKTQGAVVRAKINELDGGLAFFKQNTNCPTCGQPIQEATVDFHKHETEEAVEQLGKKLEVHNLDQTTTKAEADASHIEWQTANERKNALEKEKATLQAQIAAAEKELDSLEKQAVTASEETNPYEKLIQDAIKTRAELDSKLEQEQDKVIELTDNIAQLSFWKDAFKRVRLFCIRRVLTELEIETANASTVLGLVDWKVKYATETENKSGTAKMGVQIEIQTPWITVPYEAYSGGEAQRIRLCIALGLANMIQRWAGVSWDLEVYDEPSSWLSNEGIEDLLECLRNRADVLGKQMYICDHRALAFSGFDSMITVVKDATGSHWYTGALAIR